MVLPTHDMENRGDIERLPRMMPLGAKLTIDEYLRAASR